MTATELWITGAQGPLQAYLWRPVGSGPFPALVYNHGSEREPLAGTRSDVGPFFAANGYAVLFPYRRGSGRSAGTYWQDRVNRLPEGQRPQGAIDAIVAENDDVASAVEWLRGQPFVDKQSISVAGCSFGGIHSLLAAARPLGLATAVDFAGGAMSWADSPLLRNRMVAAAEGAQVPVFFVQAENDFDTTPTAVLSGAMVGRQKPSRVQIFPPFGTSHEEGHGKFCMRGTGVWGPAVLDFLKNRR